MSARVLSEHQRRVLVKPDELGVHDLVRLLILQDAVLVLLGAFGGTGTVQVHAARIEIIRHPWG